MPPTILFVPGIWEGPSVFNHVSSLLSSAGFKTSTAVLPSTGTTSPGNPSMKDDIAAIRRHLQDLLQPAPETGTAEDVLLVLHSAGGFLGSEAMQGLHKTGSSSAPGVIGIVFLAGAIFPLGHEHQPLPFAVVDGGASHCAQPEKLLFGDLPAAEKSAWLAKLQPQPAQGWDGRVEYTGWKDVPSVYLVCEGDELLPMPLQEQLAGLAGSKVERCSAGHVPQVSQPERVVEVVKGAVEEFVRGVDRLKS
ncbi:Alpha/beta hydrolase fold-1 [Talaromyces proteolyticus]|uniref:Alpha/beta hydrolase fold-1 n=1 Tax=Talaromyces proteolyticus TaxID=1131652 RepID=A0AAD4KRZ8_9EURO|nr:Alpha/beta hydrolase fold-1 [Talaromyces proteolyticus]KAH8695237.1 Alpha/beta hydrolase fold-1 [Talaromyces proteolyticus]